MKEIVFSSVALFVGSMSLGFVIRGLLLRGDDEASGLMRSDAEQQQRFALMLLAHVLIAVGFTLIYRRGREAKPWPGQGLRFGLLWSLASVLSIYLVQHVVGPYERGLVAKQMALDTIGVTLLGLVAAFVNAD